MNGYDEAVKKAREARKEYLKAKNEYENVKREYEEATEAGGWRGPYAESLKEAKKRIEESEKRMKEKGDAMDKAHQEVYDTKKKR